MNVLSLAFQAPQIPGIPAPSFMPYNSPPRTAQGQLRASSRRRSGRSTERYRRRNNNIIVSSFFPFFFFFPASQDTFSGSVLNGRGGTVAPAPLQPRAATIESVFLPLQVSSLQRPSAGRRRDGIRRETGPDGTGSEGDLSDLPAVRTRDVGSRFIDVPGR